MRAPRREKPLRIAGLSRFTSAPRWSEEIHISTPLSTDLFSFVEPFVYRFLRFADLS